MKAPRRLFNPALLGAAVLLGGCSGSTEDVRVTFCKNLAIAQLSAAPDAEWDAPRQVVKHQEYAQITVQLKGGGRTSCWFEYGGAAEEAAPGIDSLDPFSTLPYQVSVNGRLLSPQATRDAVNAEQRRMGREAVRQLRQAAER